MATRALLTRASQALAVIAMAGVVSLPASAQSAGGDAQLSGAVETALMNNAQLKSLGIGATTSNGVVTLTGVVPNEADRTQAEQVAGAVDGVRSIQDNLTIDASSGDGGSADQSAANQAPPPPDDDQASAGSTVQQPADSGQQTAAAQPAAPAQDGSMPPPPPTDSTASNGNAGYGGGQGQYSQNQYGQQPQPGPYDQGQYGQGQYGDEANNGWGQRGNAHVPQGYNSLGVSPQQQNTSGPVTVPTASLLSVRTEQPMSTQNLRAGDTFQVTASADVYENGVVAIPRGAVLTGQVVESKNSGAFGGRPKLDLRLTSIQLGPTSYPVVSQVWSSQGPNKAGQTAADTAGGAIFGALIGAVAGGGVGAGVGALAGGAGGATISGISQGPHIVLPPETLLQFQLAQPLTVQPVQVAEAERLANSVPPAPRLVRRRVYYAPYPPPYPYYYGAPYPY